MLKFCFSVLLAMAIAFAWSPRQAQAQENDAAFDAAVAKGVENYKARKYNAAIKYFRDAYALKPDPTLIFNIARSYERLGKVEDAIANYQAYVDAPGTTTEDRADALNRIKALKQEQAARDAALNADEPQAPPLPAETKTNGARHDNGDGARSENARSETVNARIEPEPKNNTTISPKSGFIVIVNKSNPVMSLSKTQIADIYFGRTASWPNGARMRPYSRPAGSEAGKMFFSSAVGVDAGKYSQHWQQKQLSGAGLAPANVESVAALIKAVAANPGAIGYLTGGEAPANMDGVRVVELR
jgi:hypothetical protein